MAGGAEARGTQREGHKRDEHVMLQTWEHLTLLDGCPTSRGRTQETGVSADTALIPKMQYTRLVEHQATLHHTKTHVYPHSDTCTYTHVYTVFIPSSHFQILSNHLRKGLSSLCNSFMSKRTAVLMCDHCLLGSRTNCREGKPF